MSTKCGFGVTALAVLIVSFVGGCSAGDGDGDGLRVGFYKGKCGDADVELIVLREVSQRFFKDPTLVAALTRMHFHDCFVNGCDASILLNGTTAEKTAPPNRSVRGYDVIDAAKAAVEKVCPGVVSCSDIIAVATRDVVALAGGGRYDVETGRRDGVASLASNVDLPSPSISVSDSITAFANKNLNVVDMVYLLGGHTVGVTHCLFFQDRLYDFQNTGNPDPTMDQTLRQKLRALCPERSSANNNTANLDQNPTSAFTVDNSFYKQIMMRKGILQIDQELALDPLTSETVRNIAMNNDFKAKFGQAMVKMGAIDVLTGTDGEIRRTCGAVNSWLL